MKITTKRPTAGELAAVSGKSEEKWAGILEHADVFVAARDDDVLVGFSYAHGDSDAWTVERLWVATEHRSSGIGTKIRLRVLKECTKRTVGGGVVRGYITARSEPFWDSIDGTTLTHGATGERIIDGDL